MARTADAKGPAGAGGSRNPLGPGCGIMAGGEIIHRSRDPFGEITVSEECGRRSLLSGNGTLQSLMFVDRPACLAMDYSQAMMTSLLFHPHPEKVLLIGLGGGTMANFLLETCPAARIDAVEISSAMVAVARDYFGLPKSDLRLNVVEADGKSFVAEHAGSGIAYDLVLVDAFDECGVAAPLREKDFFEDCRSLMGRRSVFCVNLWDRPQDGFADVLERLDAVFDGATLKLHLGENYCNVVMLGFCDPLMARNIDRLRPLARHLGSVCGINLSRFLRNLAWQNPAPRAHP